MTLTLGYNTNGLAHHRWQDAFELIEDCGYRSVAITVDHHLLDPWSARFQTELEQVAVSLESLKLGSVIETGARFLMNPKMKHEPTLISEGKRQTELRISFLQNCIDIAAHLQSDAVSFWAGVLRRPISWKEAFEQLVDGCKQVADYAEKKNVRLAFEPEPGMLIETMEQYAELERRVNSPLFGLTIDIGHLQCVENRPISELLREYREKLWSIHIEDMVRGVHEHLRFGEGEIDFPPIIRTLSEIGYTGGIHVELSRHSHMAPEVLRESYEFLQSLIDVEK